uniref:Cse1 domain-containing protein n=1 Tax=Globodera pallida TaxID=36090 RepID=A0A183CNV4_GLOPA
SVLEPVFIHFELHHKWDPPATFAIKTFKAILYSIQSQNSYFVIQELINQLELQPTTEPEVRVGMATVLARIVSIAGTSIGPLLLAIFNSLLKQLRSSVEFQQSRQCTDHETERLFQDTLINALGDFASALPDYQKVEIMMFTAASIPIITESNNSASAGATTAGEQIKWVQTSEAFLQKLLVKTLLQVATKYKTLYLATVFTDAFLKTLLQLQLTTDPEVRLIAQRIFHTLLDRHENQARLEHIQFVADLDIELQLSVEKCSRQDQLVNNII